ncbi:uncharacterized protein [Anas acuta]|uniref:uncharacterized protein isoform X1 n=1 Tax=Anas acuta TaxID=28680 RepID=UPI0035C91CE7
MPFPAAPITQTKSTPQGTQCPTSPRSCSTPAWSAQNPTTNLSRAPQAQNFVRNTSVSSCKSSKSFSGSAGAGGSELAAAGAGRARRRAPWFARKEKEALGDVLVHNDAEKQPPGEELAPPGGFCHRGEIFGSCAGPAAGSKSRGIPGAPPSSSSTYLGKKEQRSSSSSSPPGTAMAKPHGDSGAMEEELRGTRSTGFPSSYPHWLGPWRIWETRLRKMR